MSDFLRIYGRSFGIILILYVVVYVFCATPEFKRYIQLSVRGKLSGSRVLTVCPFLFRVFFELYCGIRFADDIKINNRYSVCFRPARRRIAVSVLNNFN